MAAHLGQGFRQRSGGGGGSALLAVAWAVGWTADAICLSVDLELGGNGGYGRALPGHLLEPEAQRLEEG